MLEEQIWNLLEWKNGLQSVDQLVQQLLSTKGKFNNLVAVQFTMLDGCLIWSLLYARTLSKQTQMPVKE